MQRIFSAKRPKILVIGDIIIDKYIWGTCERISPEAPVPVVRAHGSNTRLGGAANVYANLAALEARVDILSIVGDDENLPYLKENLNGHLIAINNHRTPLKTRIMAANQQITRLDDEIILKDFNTQEFLDIFSKIACKYDAFVLSDYAKGLLKYEICQSIIKLANTLKKPILIDPKGEDYQKYKHATLLTPNKAEASKAGFFSTNWDLNKSLAKMKKDLDLKYSLITLSEEGIAYYDNEAHLAPAKAREVFDVTGAGDSVIATLAFCLALNLPLSFACSLANEAAALVVQKLGCAQASLNELAKAKKSGLEAKIKTQDELLRMHSLGKVVFTNGCFDLLHFGHLSYLLGAKALGDTLIVGLNSDSSVKQLKGDKRPINCQAHRAAMLAALYFVDYVVIFDDKTPLNLIKALRPNVLVKGADYAGKKVVGEEFANELILLKYHEGLSSTNIIRKINEHK